MLRMSTLFLRTLREDPADAEVPSHRLLVRAGYVRRVAAGIYSWLPLGLHGLLDNVERIVREEMDRIGAQEVHFPALLPREPYEATGRWAEYGDQLFRLKDRKGADYLLGPTHEELFTLLVKGEYASYKDFPVIALPDPDEVPRRGASPVGHPARPRVRHEGLLLLRPGRRRAAGLLRQAPRRLHRHVRPARPELQDRLGGRGSDGRVALRGVPRAHAGRRGHLRLLHVLRLRRQRRGGDHGGRRRSRRPTTGPSRCWTPRTPRPSRRSPRTWTSTRRRR